MTRLFVTATGTGCGKTVVTRALALALRRGGDTVAAVKPVETGCADGAADARELARACGRPELADAPGFHRGLLPVAPYAAALAGERPPPPLDDLASAVRAAIGAADHVLVEGAGGPLVPYDARHDFTDLAAALALPVLVVAPDSLGVLSHTLAAVHAITSRGVAIAAVVLNRFGPGDPSRATNARILAERLHGVPVRVFAAASLDDDALADAAVAAGLAGPARPHV